MMSQECRILAGYRESGRDVPLDRVLSLFMLEQDEKRRLFIDIGSGEGQILEYFARNTNFYCLGIESDAECMKKASKRIYESSLQDKVTLHEGDAEQFPFASYCESYDEIFVYMFLSSFGYSVMGRLILSQLPIGTRVVTAGNPIGEYWKPLCAWLGNESTLILYLSILTEEARQAAFITEPSLQETRWMHPPPGSYFPKQVPEFVHIIPSDTSSMDARRMCQNYPQQGDYLPLEIPPAVTKKPSTPSIATQAIPSRPTPPPPPPPLPPPLPLPGKFKLKK